MIHSEHEIKRLNLTIMFGEVLQIYGVPQDFELLKQYGTKIFDRRTKVNKEAVRVRTQQLKNEYGIA